MKLTPTTKKTIGLTILILVGISILFIVYQIQSFPSCFNEQGVEIREEPCDDGSGLKYVGYVFIVPLAIISLLAQKYLIQKK